MTAPKLEERKTVRRQSDAMRGRMLDLLLGLVLGALASTALGSVLLASRLAKVETILEERVPRKP